MKLKKIKKISDIKTDWGCQYLIKLQNIWVAGRFLMRPSAINGNDTLHFRPLPMDTTLREIDFVPPKTMEIYEIEEENDT